MFNPYCEIVLHKINIQKSIISFVKICVQIYLSEKILFI